MFLSQQLPIYISNNPTPQGHRTIESRVGENGSVMKGTSYLIDNPTDWSKKSIEAQLIML